MAVTGNVAKGSELEKKYLEFQAAVNTVLTKDLKGCAQAEGVRGKLRQVASQNFEFRTVFWPYKSHNFSDASLKLRKNLLNYSADSQKKLLW